MHRLRACCFAALLTGLSVAGCAGDTKLKRPDVFKTSGKITMNGAPVANASVSFSPKKKQPVAFGRTDAEGTYTLTTFEPGDGAAPGDYVVIVSKSVAAAPAAASHDAYVAGGGAVAAPAQHAAAGGGVSGVPEKYSSPDQSDLFATVKETEANVFNFDLKP